jgi:hypothetical protein
MNFSFDVLQPRIGTRMTTRTRSLLLMKTRQRIGIAKVVVRGIMHSGIFGYF